MSAGVRLSIKIGLERIEAWRGLKNLANNFLRFLCQNSHVCCIAWIRCYSAVLSAILNKFDIGIPVVATVAKAISCLCKVAKQLFTEVPLRAPRKIVRLHDGRFYIILGHTDYMLLWTSEASGTNNKELQSSKRRSRF